MHPSRLALGSALAFSVFALFACQKKETPTGDTSSASATPSASEAPAASSAPNVTASAVPSSSADPTTAVSASPSASAVASETPQASASAAAAGKPAACGTKPLPDCPLQAWMKANMNPPVTAGDTAALATAFDKAATFAPPGYTNWASIAKDGAKAAKGGDMAAAKQSCRTCHDQYKAKFKGSDQRGKKI